MIEERGKRKESNQPAVLVLVFVFVLVSIHNTNVSTWNGSR